MREIPLTQGKVAFVDDVDYERVSEKKWHFSHGYAKNKGSEGSIYLHRVVMEAKPGQYVDHKNGDKLDNRRSNLRFCTMSQNLGNSRRPITNTSGIKGVAFNKALKYWTATIKVNQRVKVKYRKTKEEAAIAYEEMAREHFGEFARTV